MLRKILEFFKVLPKGYIKPIVVEGKQTKESKGRTLRLRAERERKDRYSRIGNKSSE